MAAWPVLLVIHVILLLLASTSFTIVSGLAGEGLRWQSFQYLSQSGWGTPYQFPYELPVVLTYLAAYGIGVAAYALIWRQPMRLVGALGIACCALGFVSFAYELTHWFRESYNSWIVSLPGPLLVLAAAALVQGWWRRTQRSKQLSS
jgi:hypothetical protein